jgi:hypothetical protein
MAVEVKNLTTYPKNPRAGYTVIFEVTGPTNEVHRWIERYQAEYPPEGYGTWTPAQDELPGGRLRVTVRRSNSCD